MRPYIVSSIPNIRLGVPEGLPFQSGIVLSMMVNKAAFKISMDFGPRLKKPFTLRNGLIGCVVPNALEDKGLNPLWKQGCKYKGDRTPFAQAAQVDRVEPQTVHQFAEFIGSVFKVSLFVGEVTFRPTVAETIVSDKGNVPGKSSDLVFPGLARTCAIVEPDEGLALPVDLVIYGSLTQAYFGHLFPGSP
jgi:hypothetical protein